MPVNYLPVEDEIYKRKIDFSGPIDMTEYYETLWDKIRSLDFTVYEYHHQKVVRSTAEDIFIKWECVKKITSYVLFKIYVDFDFYSIKPVEVVENGKTVERKKALWRTKIKPVIVLDWKGEWQPYKDDEGEHPTVKSRLRGWYNRFIFGRKPFSPIINATGEYLQKINKLNEYTMLIVNHARTYFGMAPISGIVEV